MKALVFKDSCLQMAAHYPKPEPGENEALIRVTMAGICGTDLEIMEGYKGFTGILGHEFCGVIEKVGEGADPESDKLSPGMRVVGEINCGCGNCGYCLKGVAAHCPERVTLGINGKDGCFAEYITLPLSNLFAVPPGVSDKEAVFIEPLAAALEITGQVHVWPGAAVAVLGDGKLGILSALTLNLTQADVTLVGKHPEKMSVAKAQGVKTARADDLIAGGIAGKYDIVVEATGSAGGFERACEIVKARGCLVLKSTTAGGEGFNLTPVVLKEITVVGSRCGPFAPALQVLEKKLLDVNPLVAAVFKFDRAVEAFNYCRSGSPLKVLLDLS